MPMSFSSVDNQVPTSSNMAAEQNPNSITASFNAVDQPRQTRLTPESHHNSSTKSSSAAKEQSSSPVHASDSPPMRINQDQLSEPAQDLLAFSSCSASDIMKHDQTLPATSLPNTAQQTPQTSQTPTNLNTFTCFPKLPIEIRFKIWHSTLPRGREVNFGNEFLFRTMWRYIPREIFQFEEELPLPIAPCVNRESRPETLKHYAVLFRGDSPLPRPQVVIPYFEPPPGIPRFAEEDMEDGEELDEKLEGGNERDGTGHELPVRQIERPFCYNPKLDIAWNNPIALQKDYCTQQPDNWLSYLASAAPSVFSETRFLEIRGAHSVWPSRVGLGSRSGFCVLYSTPQYMALFHSAQY